MAGAGRPSAGHVVAHRLDPAGADTPVTSSSDRPGVGPAVTAAGIFGVPPEATLLATLGILARTVEGERHPG